MLTTKQNEDKSCLIVKQVNVAETFRNIKPGTTVHFTRQELGNKDMTVYSAVRRLNMRAKAEEYTFSTDEHDGSWYITRRSL